MTDAMSFRVATAADLPALVALLRDDEFGRARNPSLDEAAGAYERAFARMDADNFFVVAECARRVVGCYQLTFIQCLSHAGATRAQIESVRVASDTRGVGIGSAMMRDAIDRARARGAHLVQLTTDRRRSDAQRFYERLGFAASHVGMKLTIT
jgi:ribosomal protein S18 acetylase RimI-like enzyme